MKEVLQQLANLQYIDSRIDELKQLRGDLPEDILDIETDIARLESKQDKLEQEDKNLSVENVFSFSLVFTPGSIGFNGCVILFI
mgnify:CR=1 FL=1